MPKNNSNYLPNVCGRCLNNPPSFDHVFVPYLYQGIIRQFIIHLKFNKELYYSNILGQLLLDKLRNNSVDRPDLIIPMPLHRKRLCERGFNQAKEIAKIIAKNLTIPLACYHHCQRIRYTQAQSSLPLSKRRRNVANAFLITKRLPTHVAIVDDVITSGYTANELSRALRKKGAKFIQVWCCARA